MNLSQKWRIVPVSLRPSLPPCLVRFAASLSLRSFCTVYLYLVYSAYLYVYLYVSAWTSLTIPIPRVFSRQRKQGRKCKYFALRTCSRRACTHPSVCQSARVSEALSLTAWSLAIRSSAWQHPWRFFFSAANWILLALSSTVQPVSISPSPSSFPPQSQSLFARSVFICTAFSACLLHVFQIDSHSWVLHFCFAIQSSTLIWVKPAFWSHNLRISFSLVIFMTVYLCISLYLSTKTSATHYLLPGISWL